MEILIMAHHHTLSTLISLSLLLTLWTCVDSQKQTNDIMDDFDWHRDQEEQFQQEFTREIKDPLPGLVKRALSLLAQGKTFGITKSRNSPNTFVSAVARGLSRPKDRFVHQI
uniref:Uncharacterized protein n=1 Tax=Strigamia maritima TaxID=126957 RepID=T1IY65_STRMM